MIFGIVIMTVLVFSTLGNPVKSDNVVKLRTCCELNLQVGLNECTGHFASTNISLVPGNVTDAKILEIPGILMSTNQMTKFELSSELKCKSGRANISRFPVSSSGATTLPVTFYPSGYLLIRESTVAGEFYHTSQYCINGISNSEIEIQTCVKQCSPEEPCINKCCSPDTIYTRLNLDRCVDPGQVKWTPRIFKSPLKPLNENELSKIQPWYSLRPPASWVNNCINGTLHFHPYDQKVSKILNATDYIRYLIRSDGGIFIWNKMSRRWEILETGNNYCVDGVLYQSDQVYKNAEEETFIMTCPIKLQPRFDRDPSLYYGVLASITCVFALITVIVYALLTETQNVHGWTIMSHSASIFFFLVFIAAAHLTKHDKGTHATGACLVIATLAHYFFLSTFSWLTMISFDLWLTFRSISLSKGRGLKKFLGYSVFGWGNPLFIVGLSWTLELLYKDDDQTQIVTPMYGVRMCYLTTFAFWEYIYAPCTVLMSLNLTFFLLTTWKLYNIQKSTRFATKTVQKNRQSYLLFVKLFFVVGLLWIFEIISWAVHMADIKWYWQVFDSLNCLSPVAIFFIFVFKSDVLKSLKSKYPIMKTFGFPVIWILTQLKGRNSRGVYELALIDNSKPNIHGITTSKSSKLSIAVSS